MLNAETVVSGFSRTSPSPLKAELRRRNPIFNQRRYRAFSVRFTRKPAAFEVNLQARGVDAPFALHRSSPGEEPWKAKERG